MYSFFKVIFAIIRILILANPFGTGTNAFILNIIFETFISSSAFRTTGLIYESGTFPLFGSIMYMIFYCFIIFLISVSNTVTMVLEMKMIVSILACALPYFLVYKIKNFVKKY